MPRGNRCVGWLPAQLAAEKALQNGSNGDEILATVSKRPHYRGSRPCEELLCAQEIRDRRKEREQQNQACRVEELHHRPSRASFERQHEIEQP